MLKTKSKLKKKVQLSTANEQKNTKKISRNFPCDPAVKNLPCIAGDMGLVSGQATKISQAGQLNPRAATKTNTVKKI